MVGDVTILSSLSVDPLSSLDTVVVMVVEVVCALFVLRSLAKMVTGRSLDTDPETKMARMATRGLSSWQRHINEANLTLVVQS